MKTKVVLSSSDRTLFGVTIRQSTDREMLSVTDLQRSYDKARFMHGWSVRNYSTVMQSKDFLERLFYILEDQKLIKQGIPCFMEMVENEGLVKVLKGLGVWKTSGKGSKRSVSCNPYIWVLLAMEMNPMIYAKVIVWLTDSLIFDRIEAGDGYNRMSGAINSIIPNPEYRRYATEINMNVFGRHTRGIRNLASAKQLKKIAKLEEFIVNAIEMRMITNESQLLYSIKNYKG